MKTFLKSVVLTGAFLVLPSLTQACGPAHLTIEKSGPETAATNSVITYSVRVSQTSSAGVAKNVTVHDQVPAGLTFNASHSSSECSLVGSTVECKPNTPAGILGLTNTSNSAWVKVPDNQTQTFTIAFDVPANPSNCEIENAATVSAHDSPNPNSIITSGFNSLSATSNTITTKINCATPTPAPSPTETPESTPKPTVLAKVVTPRPIAPVKVTAVTGPENFGTLITILGAAGLVLARKFSR